VLASCHSGTETEDCRRKKCEWI